MRAFRFRAEAALDLRRREESDALLAKAQAEARFSEAEQALAAERVRRETAQMDQAALERRGSDLGTLLWHRNWIVRLASDIEARAHDVESRARECEAARDAWQEARRRRLALERLRERAVRAFERDLAREERNALDELARIRYVMSAPGDLSHEHD
jgi:flagellar export protein FliJ